MKVAYVFATNISSTFMLATMILPQLEQDRHGAEVAGMIFSDDNNFILRAGDPVGEHLAKMAAEKHILLVSCSQCSIERDLSRRNCCGEDVMSTSTHYHCFGVMGRGIYHVHTR